MDWVQKAKILFESERPEHFTNYKHCEECAEHDETLRNAEIDTIGLDVLGNPGWDPICFSTVEGKKYYMPSFIRLCLETIENEFYFGQFLFHLEGDGRENSLVQSCTEQQRKFISSFIEYMLDSFTKEIESNCCTDEVLKVYEIWSNA
jgi:hypothetical protein